MRVVCVGGGPAGLYLAIALKRRDATHDVTVIERNRPFDTFGWGVVFSDQTMENLRAVDRKSADAIFDSLAHWDDIDVHVHGQVIRSGGHGFCGIGRKRLLNILQERAQELGVALKFETDADPDTVLATYDADLIVASDGVNSKMRARWEDVFKPRIEMRRNKFVWLGTHKTFEAFTFGFEQTEHGWIWFHAYKFDPDTSTFIVECDEPTWRGLGFDTLSQEDSIALCERIFAKYLDGNGLMSNARHLRGSAWLNFPHVTCERWHHKNVVLMGDAAHTAHFSVGSGTKLALEDAMALAERLHDRPTIAEALSAYQAERSLDVVKLQNAARNSTEWFEHLPRYLAFEPMQFAYSLLTRSQRVSHDNLRARDKQWLDGLETWFAQRAGAEVNQPVPPMFTPFKLRGLTLPNRIVVSPMSMYSAKDGVPGDFHLVHYGSRAQGGAGMVVTEMTDVSEEGRITPGCTGLYTDAQEAAWKRIVDFVHAETPAKFCLQLGHAGPKGSTQLGWEEMDAPLAEGNWPLLAPSAIAWSPRNQLPRAMTRADMDLVRDQYVAAAKRAVRCGFDMIELHFAHGYLLSAFLTPVTNKRTDEYGGAVENRLRFPLEVFRAVRDAWPADKPISVRLSATDWCEHGNDEDDTLTIAAAFRDAGVDVIDVSAGQTTIEARPVYGRMFQTPFSDLIRNEARVATMAVGNIYEIDHVNSIIAAGRADLCCMARPHLSDPYWTLRAAAAQQVAVEWPKPYLSGRDQLQRLMVRPNG
ncbi:bifunctional salicylyl-CoA 5-hydroxylase/oxidoreductase [Roseiterribacter gracilis]|uniref:NADH:flavin oxidoreductase n=1 Tax=Roseiterribacter gracilis TaxID=2812848 RepID=A0A8S8XCU3_9PROT|nr:NADH:flavin oxidoreductase [Rhodospirillales bacterium TMPK1]